MSDPGEIEERFAEHNALATYPDMEAAREAIVALEHAGVEASHISLLGPAADEARDGAATDDELRQADMEMTTDVGKRAAAGAGIGGVAGAALGAAVMAIPGIGPVLGAGMIAAAVGGGAFGAATGGFIGAGSGQPVSNAWELTYQSVKEGKTCVAVHTDDAGTFERAVQALDGTDPEDVVVFDADGRSADRP